MVVAKARIESCGSLELIDESRGRPLIGSQPAAHIDESNGNHEEGGGYAEYSSSVVSAGSLLDHIGCKSGKPEIAESLTTSGSDAGSSIRRLLAPPFPHHAPITATQKTTHRGQRVKSLRLEPLLGILSQLRIFPDIFNLPVRFIVDIMTVSRVRLYCKRTNSHTTEIMSPCPTFFLWLESIHPRSQAPSIFDDFHGRKWQTRAT
jgi:hypothetical protein